MISVKGVEATGGGHLTEYEKGLEISHMTKHLLTGWIVTGARRSPSLGPTSSRASPPAWSGSTGSALGSAGG